MPIQLVEHKIKDHNEITQEADLVNKILEVEDSTTDQNFKVSIPTLVQTVANNLPGGNNSKVAVKTARVYSTADPNYGYPDETLTGLNPDFLCLYTTCWVEFPLPTTEYILVYDGSTNPALMVWRDGDFTGQKIGAKWVPVGSIEAELQQIADFSPMVFSYNQGDNVKFPLDGQLRLFAAKMPLVKSTFTPQLIPEPTGLSTDPNWQEISSGANANISDYLPGTYKRHDVVYAFGKVYRAKTDYVVGDYINDPGTYDNFPDPDYWEIIAGGSTPVYNDAPLTARVVALEDASETQAATIADNYTELSTAIGNLHSTAKAWVAGPYVEGEWVRYNNVVFFAKQNIQNSTVPPTPANTVSSAFWSQVGGGSAAQNSLTPPSSALAPSVDAVTAGLALKADVTYVDAADTQLQTNLNLLHDDLQQQIDLLPNGSDFVHKTGDETVGGNKIFTGTLSLTGKYPGGPESLNTSSDIVLGEGANLFFGTYSYGQRYIGTHSNYGNTFGVFTPGGGVFFPDSGSVGIGAISPTEKLEVYGNVKADKFILGQSTITPFGITTYNATYKVYSENGDLQLQSRDGDVSIGSGNLQGHTPNLVVKNGGNVGINTTAPTEKLEVAGNVKATAFIGDGSRLTGLPSGADVTKAYVDAADSALSDRVTTNTNNIGLKAPINSPDFTGFPTAPVITNTSPGNQIATADFVRKSFSTAPLITAIGFDGVIRYDFTELQPAVFWSQRNNQGGHGAYGGYEGYVILGRPILTNDCGQIGIGGTVDANNNAISANPYGFTLYSGSQIINNSLYFGSTIYIRDNSYSTVKPRIQGGIVAAAFNFSAGTTSTLILDGVTVTDCGGPAYLEGGKRVSTDGGGTIILRNGAKFLNFPPHSTTTVITEAFVRTTTTVTFDADAEYNPVYSGTFTVSDTNKVVGKVVTIYLGPSATEPTIPTTGYKCISGAYTAGKNLMYMFKVGANNQIQYTITNLD